MTGAELLQLMGGLLVIIGSVFVLISMQLITGGMLLLCGVAISGSVFWAKRKSRRHG
jgi:uncharacterized membrane protein YccC